MRQASDEEKEKLTTQPRFKNASIRFAISLLFLGIFAYFAWSTTTNADGHWYFTSHKSTHKESFLSQLAQAISDAGLVARLESSRDEIVIYSAAANFAARSTQLNALQSKTLGKVARILQAATQCTDTNAVLQLAAKPLENGILPTKCPLESEEILFSCKNDFKKLRLESITVQSNDLSDAVAQRYERKSHQEARSLRDLALVNAFYLCEPELRRLSYFDSKPILRTVDESSSHTLNREIEKSERTILKFQFE